MTGPRRTYPYPCPTCGREVIATAAYAARHANPCRGCLRERNGWQHAAGCGLSPDHLGPCEPAA